LNHCCRLVSPEKSILCSGSFLGSNPSGVIPKAKQLMRSRRTELAFAFDEPRIVSVSPTPPIVCQFFVDSGDSQVRCSKGLSSPKSARALKSLFSTFSAACSGILDEREVAQHLLQADNLTRNKLCNSQSDDIGDGTHVCNESSRFVARQAVSLRTKTEDDLVAIYDIDIEMDSNTRAPQRFEPIEKRLTGEVKFLRTKRSDPPTGYAVEIVFGPGMQADKRYSSWIEGGRQKAKYIRISMTSEDCNRHSMVSGVFTSGSADVGVRI